MEKRVFTTDKIIKIVLIGPESTGKTTLSRHLAEIYQTCVVEEYMRSYLQQKWNLSKEFCQWEDLDPILVGQIQLEELQLKQAKQLLFIDTNPLVLSIYAKLYYQACPESITNAVKSRHYDYYLLTSPDIPWQFDILRDKPTEREWLFYLFKQELLQRQLPFTVLSGQSFANRITQAQQAINSLLTSG